MTVKTFISRPLLSIVISVFIVLLGVISLLSLPVERYPDIAPPAIYVWASYPGASAETVHKSVVMPLEEAMNGLSVTLFTTTLVFMVIFIPVAFVGGITREESQTSGRVIFIFLICIVFAYLVTVALYESLFIPLSVMLSVPFGLAGSLLFAKLFGVENNIYMQIGMVMLVGLLSKTAILLTEYASQARREGMSLAEAALRSAKVRLRPCAKASAVRSHSPIRWGRRRLQSAITLPASVEYPLPNPPVTPSVRSAGWSCRLLKPKTCRSST